MRQHVLAEMIAERVHSGLKRKSLTTCSRWACACRQMGQPFPGPWTFKYHPWLREMHDSESELNVGQKSAQMGYTEWALNTTFFNIDVKGRDCLYVLPAQTPDASDFSSARFDAALELSPHLSKLFSDVKNVGHKRAGTANLYVRGSKSRSGLKSIPVGLIVLDEVDEMDQDNIPLAMERAAGQVERQVLMLSTPTIGNKGINKYYKLSSQEHFFFKCPSCNRLTELIFPDCLEITAELITDPKINESFLKCKECKAKLPHETKPEWLKSGVWVPSYTDRDSRGFHISQLYSFAKAGKPAELAKAYKMAEIDPTSEQEFYNSKLGVPHIVADAAVSDAHIDECRSLSNYKNKATRPRGCITMGVDVGKWLHIEIDHWLIPNQRASTDLNIESTPRVIYQGKVSTFEELDRFLIEYGVHSCVIDANPERRKAYEFACRFWGHIKLCQYGRGITGKQIHVMKDKTDNVQDEHTVTVDRTSWLDLSLGRFKRKAIHLPIDVDMEYQNHIKALVRMYEKDKDGNSIGRYINGSDDDHYAHARNYAELALPFAASFGSPQDIEGVV